MRPEERDPAYLWDMLEAARSIVDIMGNLTLSRFLEDSKEMRKTRLAVEREFEVLGEAARRISLRFRKAHPEISWSQVIGLRNFISHEYDKVDYERIYRLARQEVPDLVSLLQSLIPPLPPMEEHT